MFQQTIVHFACKETKPVGRKNSAWSEVDPKTVPQRQSADTWTLLYRARICSALRSFRPEGAVLPAQAEGLGTRWPYVPGPVRAAHLQAFERPLQGRKAGCTPSPGLRPGLTEPPLQGGRIAS